jgi:hypothetical protein
MVVASVVAAQVLPMDRPTQFPASDKQSIVEQVIPIQIEHQCRRALIDLFVE